MGPLPVLGVEQVSHRPPGRTEPGTPPPGDPPGEWIFYQLYVLIDILSRFNPSWIVCPVEDSLLAKDCRVLPRVQLHSPALGHRLAHPRLAAFRHRGCAHADVIASIAFWRR